MKNKLLGVSTEPYVNIGDYIQALASAQFLPTVDGFIQRETIDEYDGDISKMIMNGWYMIHPQHWPPSKKIIPVFYAFHINAMAKKELLEDNSIAYLKRFEPIGCRDTNTANMLKEKGVQSFFSGCLTLTLGYKYKSTARENKCYIVDAYHINSKTFPHRLKIIKALVFNWKSISIIEKKKFSLSPLNKIRRLVATAGFFVDYTKYFTKETLVEAEYICQESEYYKRSFPSDEKLLKEAERLITLYSKAKLVITSRIHCALPCLGLETPVIYVENSRQGEVSACRLGGLRDLFTVFSWKNDRLVPPYKIKRKISIDNPPQNKETWKPLAQKLISSLTTIFNDDK